MLLIFRRFIYINCNNEDTGIHKKKPSAKTAFFKYALLLNTLPQTY